MFEAVSGFGRQLWGSSFVLVRPRSIDPRTIQNVERDAIEIKINHKSILLRDIISNSMIGKVININNKFLVAVFKIWTSC